VRKAIIVLVAVFTLAIPFEANATLQCVTYARDITGLNLKGDAWKWWEAASGVYGRGSTPKDGAVLVFKRQGSMVHGHVAVVRKTTSSRIVLVDHANWAPRRSAARGKVAESVPVMDVSPNNDWSQVRVWYEPGNQFGDRAYKTVGFVYRPSKAAPIEHASVRGEAAAPAAKLEPTLAIPAVMPDMVAPTAPSAPLPATTEVVEQGRFDPRAWAEQA
jgi:hypothetical protein